MAAANIFEGSYTLTEAVDNTLAPLTLPGTYQIRLTAKSDLEYSLHIKIGNSMGTNMHLQNNAATTVGVGSQQQTVSVDSVRSTMMMPRDDLYQLEIAVSAILPEVNSIQLQDSGVLTLEGSRGKLVCQKNLE
jgi:META domain